MSEHTEHTQNTEASKGTLLNLKTGPGNVRKLKVIEIRKDLRTLVTANEILHKIKDQEKTSKEVFQTIGIEKSKNLLDVLLARQYTTLIEDMDIASLSGLVDLKTLKESILIKTKSLHRELIDLKDPKNKKRAIVRKITHRKSSMGYIHYNSVGETENSKSSKALSESFEDLKKQALDFIESTEIGMQVSLEDEKERQAQVKASRRTPPQVGTRAAAIQAVVDDVNAKIKADLEASIEAKREKRRQMAQRSEHEKIDMEISISSSTSHAQFVASTIGFIEKAKQATLKTDN